jgi:uncharacterized SAM-binding protein YcdF (DUF218 family)
VSTQTIRIIEWLLLPPGITIILILLAIQFRKKNIILWLAILSLYSVSINFTANQLLSTLERPDLFPPLTRQLIKESRAEAIIILGHSRYHDAPEYDGKDTLNTGGLARVRYGAKLHRDTGLPILAAGGAPGHEAISEAAIMKRVLAEEFNVPVRWLEEKSHNTYENALLSSEILEKAQVKRVLMVTHSRDIARALWAFQNVGILHVTPAPTLFAPPAGKTGLRDWIPNPYALSRTAVALHELAGMLWYRWKHE